MTEIGAFLFDLDGTLVDSRDSNYFAYREAFSRAGYDLTRAEFATTWGRDSRDFIPDLIDGISPSEVSAIRVVKAEVYESHLVHSRVNTELVAFARGMRNELAVGLVTTAKRRNVEDVLRAHDMADLFTIIVTGDDVEVSKPDPAPYLIALDLLRLPPEQTIAFEDSEAGIASATAAGISVVRVTEFGA
jgi:beta-phosphoglucomutase